MLKAIFSNACVAECINIFFIFLFPTSDNYCNKLYKNKIAILALKRHLFDDEYWKEEKKCSFNEHFFQCFFFTRLLICDFFLSVVYTVRFHSMTFLRTVHTKWNKRWHVWYEWHFRNKNHTHAILRNQKKIERDFFPDCRIRYTQIFIYL